MNIQSEQEGQSKATSNARQFILSSMLLFLILGYSSIVVYLGCFSCISLYCFRPFAYFCYQFFGNSRCTFVHALIILLPSSVLTYIPLRLAHTLLTRMETNFILKLKLFGRTGKTEKRPWQSHSWFCFPTGSSTGQQNFVIISMSGWRTIGQTDRQIDRQTDSRRDRRRLPMGCVVPSKINQFSRADQNFCMAFQLNSIWFDCGQDDCKLQMCLSSAAVFVCVCVSIFVCKCVCVRVWVSICQSVCLAALEIDSPRWCN